MSGRAAGRDAKKRALGALAGVLALAHATSAHAQELEAHQQSLELDQFIFNRTENVPVLVRVHPEWNPVGFSFGSFALFPQITLTENLNDNILATSTQPLTDTIFTLQPQLVGQTNFRRMQLILTAGATLNRYATYATQDTDGYNLMALFSDKIHDDLAFNVNADYSTVSLPRTSDAYYESSVIPLLYRQGVVEAGVVEESDHVKITESGTFRGVDYTNGLSPSGAAISEAFLNQESLNGFVRGDYAPSPALDLFADESLTHKWFSTATGKDGYVSTTLVGSNFDITHLLTADLGIGYLYTSFAASRPISTVHFNGKLVYFPTQLLTLTLTATQGVVDSGLPSAPVFLEKTVGLEADYEFLRNVIVIASVTSAWSNYHNVDRRDLYGSASLGATYSLNRGVALNLSYSRFQRQSYGLARAPDFSVDVLALAIILQH